MQAFTYSDKVVWVGAAAVRYANSDLIPRDMSDEQSDLQINKSGLSDWPNRLVD